MAVKLACPACGGDVLFQSPVSVSVTCPWCSSLLLRHDLDLEKLGTESLPPPDLSVVQIGAQGKYRGTAFTVIGKLVVGWADGRWNEWYVCFEDGRDGWLAEAQGDWMLSYQEHDTNSIPARDSISLGATFPLRKNESFTVDDFRDVECLGCLGELPLKAAKGRKGLSVDLSSAGEQFACIEYSDNESRLFIGQYVDFDTLHMTGLRELDGWQ